MLGSQILIISPEPWHGHFVSKHHYAITLASQGYKVYFLNPPSHSLSMIEVCETKYDNLWTVDAPQVAKGLRFYPKFLQHFIEKRWLKKLENKIEEKFTTIWLFENSRFYDMDFAGDRFKIYHQVDLNQNFHIKEASSSADICFCASDYILEEIKQYSQKVHKINHGVSKSKLEIRIENIAEKFKITVMNVSYIGNLDMKYLDFNLLGKVVKAYPTITFHFVGGYTMQTPLYQETKDMSNIIWWGKVDSVLISSFLSLSDILLVSYQKKHFVDQANPHKLMEYLSSGKVVVSTYTDEYKDKRELLEMVDDSRDYIQKFDEVVKNLDFYNSEDKQKNRINFAKEHSYEKQLEKIVKYLDQYNFKF